MPGNRFSPGGCCCKKCTTDVPFVYYSEFTNVDGDGKATITVDPAIGGFTEFLVTPVHHEFEGREWWVLTIEDIYIPDGTYTWTMSRTGEGNQEHEITYDTCLGIRSFGCLCGTLPDTVDITSVGTPDPNSRPVVSATLNYGPLPDDYTAALNANAVLWSPCHWAGEFQSPTDGVWYILMLRCRGVFGPSSQPHIWYMTRPTAPPTLASSLSPRYAFSNPGTDNSCDPLLWVDGAALSGSAGIDVTLTG